MAQPDPAAADHLNVSPLKPEEPFFPTASLTRNTQLLRAAARQTEVGGWEGLFTDLRDICERRNELAHRLVEICEDPDNPIARITTPSWGSVKEVGPFDLDNLVDSVTRLLTRVTAMAERLLTTE